ncbi:SPOR domain-containing protein [Candidatus Omnitrophota bacterium]
MFGFGSKDKESSKSLSEADIRNKLYGGAVAVFEDIKESEPSKKDINAPKDFIDKDPPEFREDDQERLKIEKELKLLKKELDETKKKLERSNQPVANDTLKTWAITGAICLLVVMLSVIFIRRTPQKEGPGSKALPAQMKSVAKGRFAIQVAVYGNRPDADNFSADLNEKGYSTFTNKSKYNSGRDKFIVFVGRFDNKRSASKILSRLKDKEGIKDSFISTLPN